MKFLYSRNCHKNVFCITYFYYWPTVIMFSWLFSKKFSMKPLPLIPCHLISFTHNKLKNSKSAIVEMGLRFYRLFLCHYSGNKRSAFYFWSASLPSPTRSKALLFVTSSSQMRSIGYNVIMNTHSFFFKLPDHLYRCSPNPVQTTIHLTSLRTRLPKH